MIVIATVDLRSHLWETQIKRMISDALIFYLLNTKCSGLNFCLRSFCTWTASNQKWLWSNGELFRIEINDAE